jgi:hypothetical protein
MSSTSPPAQEGISLPGPIVAEPPRPRPAIAIVAVHGVADQPPRDSAGAVANLLLRLWRGGASLYTSFREVPIRIPTKPAVVTDPAAAEQASASTFRMEDRPGYLQAHMQAVRAQPAADGPAATVPDVPDHQFMRAQLAEYRSSRAPYETLRLEGQRLHDGVPVADVHVYEMYWADLSRLGTGLLRIFGELYQLLLHLANLGRVVVDHAALEHPSSRAWRRYAAAQAAAVRLITLATPVLGLLMLATIGMVLPGALPAGAKTPVAALVLALAGAGAAGAAAYRNRARLPVAAWALIPLAAAGAGAAAALALLRVLSVEQVLALEWLAVAALALHRLYAMYDRSRPGAAFWGQLAYGLGLGIPALATLAAPTRERIAVIALRAFEVQYLVLAASWVALAGCALAAGVAGWRLQGRLERGSEPRARARRAAWTARTTLALSAASIFLLTLLSFMALMFGLRPVLDGLAADYEPLMPYPGLVGLGRVPLSLVLDEMLITSATSGLPVLLVCMGLAAALAAWAILPAALTEVSAPPDLSAAWTEGERAERWKKAREDGDRSERLGTWLSRGIPTLAGAATVLWAALFVLMPGIAIARGAALAAGRPLAPLEQMAALSSIFLGVLGSLIGASAVGILALRGRLDVLAMGFRPALDVALDVDSYLREFPRDRTPRARIAERYVSLLRYLTLWRSDAGEPYAGIVLVTHSQGTVITADLLGFLQRERDLDLAPLVNAEPAAAGTPEEERRRTRLYLFTMGSPLRQLYGRAFPHLYSWITGRPRGWGGDLPQPSRPPAAFAPRDDHGHRVEHELAGDPAPDPWQLGVTRWVNAYRTGDYVGRELWRAPECACLHRRVTGDEATQDPPVLVVSEDAHRSRRELCVGSGAHTHYWDDTAPAVGVEVDLLVEDVLQRVGHGVPAGASRR